jgi:hypothetical protein
LGSAWVKARETSCRAEVTSLGITQNVFPGKLARTQHRLAQTKALFAKASA